MLNRLILQTRSQFLLLRVATLTIYPIMTTNIHGRTEEEYGMTLLKYTIVLLAALNTASAIEWEQSSFQADINAGYGQIKSPEPFNANWQTSASLRYYVPVFVEGHTRASIDTTALWSWTEANETVGAYGTNYAQFSLNAWYEHDFITDNNVYWFGFGVGGFSALLPQRYVVNEQNGVLSSSLAPIDTQFGLHLNARFTVPIADHLSIVVKGQYGLTDYAFHGLSTGLSYDF